MRAVSLKTKMTVAVFLLVAALMSSLAFFAYAYFEGVFKQSIFSHQFVLVSSIAREIDDKIAISRHVLAETAKRVPAEACGNPERAQKFLDGCRESLSVFDDGLFLFSPAGRLIAQTPYEPGMRGRDYSFREYFRQTVATGRPHISIPYQSTKQRHNPAIMFTVPLFGPGGKLAGILAGSFDLLKDNFFKGVSRVTIGKTGYLYAFNGERTLIIHPDRARILETVAAGKNPGFDRAIQGFEGSMENVNSLGIRGITSFKRLRSTAWILAAHYPLQEAYAPLYAAKKYFFGALVAALLLSIAVVRLAMAYLTAPLRRFTQHVADLRWKTGERKYFRGAAADEIGTLAETFNTMVEGLERQQEALLAQIDFAEKLISNATAPIFVLDPQHRILFWNKACEELTGFPAGEMLGTDRQWEPFYHRRRPTLSDVIIDHGQGDLSELYVKYASSILARDALQAEGWYFGLGGKDRYISFEAAPIRNADGELVAVIETFQDITDRKLAEDNVMLLKDFYLSLFEEFPALIWRSGTDGSCDYLNRTWLEFTGRTLEEELGEGWAAGVHPNDLEGCLKTYRESFAARTPFVMEYRLRRHDGEYRWIVDHGRPFRDPEGEFAGYIGACYDITERKLAEDALRQSEEKFSKVFHACPDWILIDTVRDGRFIDVNDAFVCASGYLWEELSATTSIELGCWVDPDQRQQLIDAAWRDGGVRNWQVRFRIKNGLISTMLWSAEIVTLGDEECLLSVARDITEQKDNERKLLRSKADLAVKHAELQALFRQVETVKREWETTLDCIQDVVILADSEGCIKRSNQAVVQFAGRPYKEILGKEWQQIVLTPEMEGQNPRELFHKGLEKWFHLTRYEYGGAEQGEIGGAVITLHDTTEIKKVHAELEKAYAELKEAQSQMLQREKMASIGQLAAGVAHEINNPIGFVMSNLGTLGKYAERLAGFIDLQSEVILSRNDPADSEKVAASRKQFKIDHIIGDVGSLIAESLDGTERVKKIVADLKSFSRVDEAEYKVADLHECLDSTINIVWNELKYKATLRKEYGEIPPVRCYPQQLNQVFMNLLVNAAHAIEKQGEITVRTWQEDDTIRVAISDTGCGIPEGLLSRIFEPFFTTKEVGKGTGLGLSISYDIVKKHQGEMTVASEVGTGTTFTIHLPFSPDRGNR